jgi:septal ring-binding cell division protein DamX
MGNEHINWRSESQINTALQSGLDLTNTQLAATNSHLSQFSRQTAQSQQVVNSEISAINDRLVTIGDQVETLDGRVTNMRPHQTFGSDNVIHSAQWIAKQPADNHTIHLATVGDKQEMYKLAQRYNAYLDKELAYLPVTVKKAQKYALIYGNFSAVNDAESALNQLPRTVQRHRPSVHTMKQVQSFITQ